MWNRPALMQCAFEHNIWGQYMVLRAEIQGSVDMIRPHERWRRADWMISTQKKEKKISFHQFHTTVYVQQSLRETGFLSHWVGGGVSTQTWKLHTEIKVETKPTTLKVIKSFANCKRTWLYCCHLTANIYLGIIIYIWGLIANNFGNTQVWYSAVFSHLWKLS